MSANGKGRRITKTEDLIELWPAVLRRLLKRLGPDAYALLQTAQPFAVTEAHIVLFFWEFEELHRVWRCQGAIQFDEFFTAISDYPRTLICIGPAHLIDDEPEETFDSSAPVG